MFQIIKCYVWGKRYYVLDHIRIECSVCHKNFKSLCKFGNSGKFKILWMDPKTERRVHMT